jgi:hypothetical protein
MREQGPKLRRKKGIPNFTGAKSYSLIPKVLFFYIFDPYSLIILCLGFYLCFDPYVLREKKESCWKKKTFNRPHSCDKKY